MKCYLIEPVYHETDRIPGKELDEWNDRVILHFVRPDTGEVHKFAHQFAPGAMWRAVWYPKNFEWENETEPHLIVICPGGSEWDIDRRASNCTMKDDRKHRCWIRHGTEPNITVDKAGHTCQAGAGSIIAGKYHGLLRNGMFT